MFTRCFLALFLFLIFSAFDGVSQKVTIAPMPSWISKEEPAIDVSPKAGDAGGYYYLLIEQHEHVRNQESFVHNAYKFLTADGIQEMADINVNFDPSYQKLFFHKLIIHREGKKIDHLKPSAIRTIQREQEMDRYIYDGSLTAIINLQDIRVGDVIEYAYTIKGYNPIYNGHVAERININYGIPYEKGIKRIIAPSDRKLYFNYKNDAPKPVEETANGMTSYTWTMEKVPAYIDDNNTPSWHDPYQSIQITDFQDWGEVVAWSVKHFSLKKEELEMLNKRVQETWNDQEMSDDAILKIIRFVQDEIRYLGFEGGLNSHKPHAPVKIFDQRFGDCKDKSLLLSSILQQRGIAASPMLVNTTVRKYVSDLLPSIHAFDHCVVEITLRGKKIYVDPTINNQGGKLTSLYFPNYGMGLVIREGETTLTKLPDAMLGGVHEVDTFKLSTTEDEATLSIRTTYKGSDADGQRSYFASNSLESIQKSYVNFYGNLYPDIKENELPKVQDDRENNVFIVDESYKVVSFWKKSKTDEAKKDGEFYSLSIENMVSVSKSSQRKSPYKLSHPSSFQHSIYANLSTGWNVKSEEKDVVADAYKYRYEVSAMGDNLRLYHHYMTLADHIPATAMTNFVNDHQEIMNTLSYSVTYGNGTESIVNINSVRWTPAVIGILAVCLSVLGIRFLYFKYDPAPTSKITDGEPIGGWLVLVAIGLSLSPLRIIWDLYQTPEYFDPESWSALWNLDYKILFSVFFLEYVYNIFIFFFSIVLIALFFNRRSSVPLLMSIFYGAVLTATLLDAIVAVSFDEFFSEHDRNDVYKDLIQSIVAAAIWIPYFNMSTRVKETFVETLARVETDNNN